MEDNLVLLKIKEIQKGILKLLFKDDIKKMNKIPTLTQTQIQVIRYILDSKSEVYQKDLEKDLNLTRATISGVLQTMEKYNLIERKANKNDARSKQVILTPSAKEKFIEGKNKIIQVENILIKDISSEELEIFFEIISKMNMNIIKYFKEGEK